MNIPVSFVSVQNSTTTPLGGGASFTGAFEDVADFSTITILVRSSHASAANGVVFEFSIDGITVDDSEAYTAIPNDGKQYSVAVVARFFRVRYVNGATPQTIFRLQSIFHSVVVKSSSHRIADTIVGEDDAEVVKATLTGLSPDTLYRNVPVDNLGVFNQSLVPAPVIQVANGQIFLSSSSTAPVFRTTYTEQTTNAQRSVVSSSPLDTSAGIGAQQVTITYLDQTGAGPFTETLTLNGLVAVNTVNTNICFIEKMVITRVGSTGSNSGTISLRATTGGGGVTIGTIGSGHNRTYWAHHYVPINKTGFIVCENYGHTGTTTSSGASFFITNKPIGVTGAVEVQVGDTTRLFGQTGAIQRLYQGAIRFAGPSHLVMYVSPESLLSITYFGSFDCFDI